MNNEGCTINDQREVSSKRRKPLDNRLRAITPDLLREIKRMRAEGYGFQAVEDSTRVERSRVAKHLAQSNAISEALLQNTKAEA